MTRPASRGARGLARLARPGRRWIRATAAARCTSEEGRGGAGKGTGRSGADRGWGSRRRPRAVGSLATVIRGVRRVRMDKSHREGLRGGRVETSSTSLRTFLGLSGSTSQSVNPPTQNHNIVGYPDIAGKKGRVTCAEDRQLQLSLLEYFFRPSPRSRGGSGPDRPRLRAPPTSTSRTPTPVRVRPRPGPRRGPRRLDRPLGKHSLAQKEGGVPLRRDLFRRATSPFSLPQTLRSLSSLHYNADRRFRSRHRSPPAPATGPRRKSHIASLGTGTLAPRRHNRGHDDERHPGSRSEKGRDTELKKTTLFLSLDSKSTGEVESQTSLVVIKILLDTHDTDRVHSRLPIL